MTRASLLASQGSPRGCISFEGTLQSTGWANGGMGAAGSWQSGLLLGFVARLGRQQFSLPWDRNTPLPAVDQPWAHNSSVAATPRACLRAAWWAVVSKGKAGETEKACVGSFDVRTAWSLLSHCKAWEDFHHTCLWRFWSQEELTEDTSVGHEPSHIC